MHLHHPAPLGDPEKRLVSGVTTGEQVLTAGKRVLRGGGRGMGTENGDGGGTGTGVDAADGESVEGKGNVGSMTCVWDGSPRDEGWGSASVSVWVSGSPAAS